MVFAGKGGGKRESPPYMTFTLTFFVALKGLKSFSDSSLRVAFVL